MPHAQQLPAEHGDKPKRLDQADYYRLVRGQLDNEDNLVNQRLIWMVFSQSFLFSAFVILTNSPEKLRMPVFAELQDALMWMMPCIGVISSLLVYIGILTSMVSMGNLRQKYDKYPEDASTEGFPALQTNPFMRMLGSLAPGLMPLLFIGTWAFLLIRQYLFNLVAHPPT